jgi:Family of unknown function (DUF6318)
VVTDAFCPDSGGHRTHVKIEYVIRRLLLLLVSAVCCVSLAACGGGGDAKASSKSSGPAIPAYAKTNDERGAQNFARYWIDTLNAATVSGDTKKLKSLQKKSCAVCSDFAKRLDGIYGAGGHVESKGFRVKSLVSESGVPAPGAGVSAALRTSAETVYEHKGAKPEKHQPSDLRLRLIMVRSGDHWLMDRIDIG